MSRTNCFVVLTVLACLTSSAMAATDSALISTLRSMSALSRARSGRLTRWMTPTVHIAAPTPKGRVENTIAAKDLADVFNSLPAERSVFPPAGQEETAILFVRDLDGGKRLVRLRMMDQIIIFTPDGKSVPSKQLYPTYIDLTFVKSGKQYLLTGCDMAVVDLQREVVDKYTQYIARVHPKREEDAAGEYQRLVAAFVRKYDPNPPKVTPLPQPRATLLPVKFVTPTVRATRKTINTVVEKRYPSFKGRQTVERFQKVGKVTLYISIFERGSTITFSYGQFTFRMRLVFTRTPKGVYHEWIVPIVTANNPPAPVQRQNMWGVVGPIKPPAVSTGTMVLTDLVALDRNHPKDYMEIVEYLKGWGPIIDTSGQADAAAIDRLVERRFDRKKYDCLFIFGNHDVVPHATIPNRMYDPKGDTDKIVYTDDFYADFDHDTNASPEIICVRMPDDPGIIASKASTLHAAVPAGGKLAHRNYAAYGMLRRTTAELIVQSANGDASKLRMSLPNTDKTFSPGFFGGSNVALNLHGSDGDGRAYWGNRPTKSYGNPTAMTVEQAVAPGALILGGPCNGAALFRYDKKTRKLIRKTSDGHMAMRFLRNGARAFVGATGLSYSSSDKQGLTYGAGLVWTKMVEHTRKGHSPAKAYMLMKQDVAKTIDAPGYPALQHKQYHQTIYLGLPPEGKRTVATTATTATKTGTTTPPPAGAPKQVAFGDQKWTDLTAIFQQGPAVDCYSDNAVGSKPAVLRFYFAFDKKPTWSIAKTPSRIADREARANMGRNATVQAFPIEGADVEERVGNLLGMDRVPHSLRGAIKGKYVYIVVVKAPDRGHYASYRLTYNQRPTAVIGRGTADRPEKGRIYVNPVIPVQRRSGRR